LCAHTHTHTERAENPFTASEKKRLAPHRTDYKREEHSEEHPQENTHRRTPTGEHPQENTHRRTPTGEHPQENTHRRTPTEEVKRKLDIQYCKTSYRMRQ
jgi:hypothetical protein